MLLRSAGGTMSIPEKRAIRREEPASGRADPRGNRAPAHVAPGLGRAGQAQPLDPEKALGGRRPFTLATIVRLEQALGMPLRKPPQLPRAKPWNGDVAPDGLGAYSRRAVTWIEGTYVTVRPVVRRQGRDLRLSHRDRLGRCGIVLVCSGKASGWTRPSASSVRSRYPINPASSIW